MNLTELKLKQISEVIDIAESLGLENVARSRKQDLIFCHLKKTSKSRR
ncbi:Rho termination factor N-terminal domain-containing protein [Methylocucumis oryzae]